MVSRVAARYTGILDQGIWATYSVANWSAIKFRVVGRERNRQCERNTDGGPRGNVFGPTFWYERSSFADEFECDKNGNDFNDGQSPTGVINIYGDIIINFFHGNASTRLEQPIFDILSNIHT